jgi:hypothetical protein
VRARFFAPVHTGPGAHPASCTMGTGSFPGVKGPGRVADHPPLPSAEVENQNSFTPFSGPFVACYRVTFTLPILQTHPTPPPQSAIQSPGRYSTLQAYPSNIARSVPQLTLPAQRVSGVPAVCWRPVQSKTWLCVEIWSPVKSRGAVTRQDGGTAGHTLESSGTLHNRMEVAALLIM